MTRNRGVLEAQVLACLAAAEGPLTAADVRSRLDESPAYTTVTTTLTRLFDKGALARGPRGRAYAYTMAERSGATVTALQMRGLMAASEDRAAVLTRFVAGLSVEDAHLLAELLTDGAPGQA